MGNPIGISIPTFLTTPSSVLINDQGSRSKTDMSLWTPDPAALVVNSVQYYYLGLFGTNNYDCPPTPRGPFFCYALNDDNGNPILEAPTGFTTVWESKGNKQPSNLGIYNPIAPPGYVSIGSIAVMDFNNPPVIGSYPLLMCVRQDMHVNVTLTESDLIWTDQGSGTPENVSVWMLPNSGAAFAYRSSRNAPYPTSIDAIDIKPMQT